MKHRGPVGEGRKTVHKEESSNHDKASQFFDRRGKVYRQVFARGGKAHANDERLPRNSGGAQGEPRKQTKGGLGVGTRRRSNEDGTQPKNGAWGAESEKNDGSVQRGNFAKAGWGKTSHWASKPQTGAPGLKVPKGGQDTCGNSATKNAVDQRYAQQHHSSFEWVLPVWRGIFRRGGGRPDAGGI